MHLVRYEAYRSIKSRTDCSIDDEAAGEMRKTLAWEADQRRKMERARILKANQENKRRLLAIVAKTDDGDGLLGGAVAPPWMTKSKAGLSRPGSPMRDELGAVRDRMKQMERDRIARENAANKMRLLGMTPTIDDDTEDDATGEARARLRVESAKKFRAQLRERSRKNAEYFARVRAAKATLDTKIWDDETVDAQGNVIKGAGREAAAAASKARKAKEAKDLAKANATFFGGLGKVQAQVDDGDGHFT